MTREIRPEAVAKNTGFKILASSTQFDHRGMVLRKVCEIEFQFKLLLIEAFRQINPGLSDSLADEERSLFGPDRQFGSLSKCLSVAKLLGIIDRDLAEDFKAMVSLRNMYAHGRKREQLDEDERAAAVVRSMHLVKNSAGVLASHDLQTMFLSSADTLSEIVVKITAELLESRSKAKTPEE